MTAQDEPPQWQRDMETVGLAMHSHAEMVFPEHGEAFDRIEDLITALLAALQATRPIIAIHAETGHEGASEMLAQIDAALTKANGEAS